MISKRQFQNENIQKIIWGRIVMKKDLRKFTVFMVLAIVMLVTGCGSSSSDFGTSTSYTNKNASSSEGFYISESAQYDSLESYDYEYDDYSIETTEESTSVDETAQTSDRKLITTVSIDAETLDFDKTTAWVESRTSELLGYIESSSISISGGYYNDSTYTDLHYAIYTIRIPEDELDNFLLDVESKTNVTSKTKSVEDITLTYTDIVARQDALEAEKKALEKLMDRAESMEDIITIQSELTDVQYQIDSIKSQLRTYDNKIDYSTIYLEIEEVEPDNLTVTEKKSIGQRIKDEFVSNLKGTGEFLLEVGIAIIVNLPQLILISVVIVVIVLILKKRVKGNRKQRKSKLFRKNKGQDTPANLNDEPNKQEKQDDKQPDKNKNNEK